MQTAMLPAHICDKIDRKIRNFIWGSVEGARKIHNIKWEIVCKPKSMGGLGLRSARDLNKAFIMKIVWGLINRPTDLWARILISKYLKQVEGGYALARKSGFSAIWRGIMKVWPHVTNGMHWSIKDCRNTRFWTDHLVDSGVLLIDHAFNFQGVDASLTVSNTVIGMSPPDVNLGRDSLVWGLEANEMFSVRSAVLMLQDTDSPSPEPFWDKLWKWEGPNKIRHFLWLVSHNQLLTNEERNRRHLTYQVLCPRCSLHSESISHVFYDCGFALQVWQATCPLAILARNEKSDFNIWWRSMMIDKQSNTSFGITAWLLWRARNKLIFEGYNQTVNAIIEQSKFWTNLVLSSWKTSQLGREAPGLARQTQLIAWRPGDEGWSTLNTDGSCIHGSGSTAIGGLIRDDRGKFVHAFCGNIGNCSITRAEIKAIVEGLKLAWDVGIRRIHVQSDSRAAISILQKEDADSHQHTALVAEFIALKRRSWEISISHVFREANCGADYLANLGHSHCIGLHFFSVPDTTLAHWLRYDLIGVALPREVSLNN
ncbi:Putative ribonuclease H protein At1g65750 [Linum perenne]